MTQNDALRWVAQLFNENSEGLSPETARDEIREWDSLGVLTLMASLDSDFGIQLEDEEVQGMKRVADILQILSRNGKIHLSGEFSPTSV